MKKSNLLAILTLAATPALLHAQTNSTNPPAYSDIVGYQTTTLPSSGYKGVGIPLLNPALVSGNVSAKASNVITVSGASNIGSLLQSGQPYYIEVISNPNVGNRFDVNVVATKTSANGTITLATNNPRNTADVTTTELTGSNIVLRKHVTLDQIRASITGTLVGNDNSFNNADAIYVYRGLGFVPYWLGVDLQSWWSTDDPEDHRFDVIAPGQGFLFRKRGSTATLVSLGVVRNNDFLSVLSSGYQLNAPAFPKSYTPVQLGGALNNGWNVNSQILVYSGTGFTINTLTSDGSSIGVWDNGEPEPANNVVVVDGDGSFFTKLSSSVVDIETKPFSN
jgi:hypothetical protein